MFLVRNQLLILFGAFGSAESLLCCCFQDSFFVFPPLLLYLLLLLLCECCYIDWVPQITKVFVHFLSFFLLSVLRLNHLSRFRFIFFCLLRSATEHSREFSISIILSTPEFQFDFFHHIYNLCLFIGVVYLVRAFFPFLWFFSYGFLQFFVHV